MLGALKIVGQMEREFSLVRELDPKFDQAGADRNLGLLYRDAPSIGSIGSRTKAKECLKRAVALAPQYPENRLNLIETYHKWGDRPDAQRELKALEEIWPRARKNFTGEAWEGSWADWEPRLKKLQKQLEDAPKSQRAAGKG
jgi:tetratricopeptide (TPR) repeat protein